MKLIPLFVLLFSLTSFADDKKAEAMDAEMMKKAQEYATPGEPHKRLAEMAGKWNYTSKWWMTSDAKPEESKGTSTMRMIMGGRYLEQNLKGMAMGKPFEGHGMTGYDNLKQQYQIIWMDSMSTGIMNATGTYDEATKTLSEKGQYSCPVTEGHTAEYRGETKWIDKNSFTYSMFGKGMNPKGAEFKMMEITYKRAK